MKPNKPTGETMSEGSDIPPSMDEPNEMDPVEQDDETSESPVKQYFESLEPSELEELCTLVHDYEKSKSKSGELDAEGLVDSDNDGM